VEAVPFCILLLTRHSRFRVAAVFCFSMHFFFFLYASAFFPSLRFGFEPLLLSTTPIPFFLRVFDRFVLRFKETCFLFCHAMILLGSFWRLLPWCLGVSSTPGGLQFDFFSSRLGKICLFFPFVICCPSPTETHRLIENDPPTTSFFNVAFFFSPRILPRLKGFSFLHGQDLSSCFAIYPPKLSPPLKPFFQRFIPLTNDPPTFSSFPLLFQCSAGHVPGLLPI